MSQLLQASPFPIPKSPSSSSKKEYQEHETEKAAAQSSVTYMYQAKVAEVFCNVTATWRKNSNNHSFCIAVENPSHQHQNQNQTCKIELNSSTQFWSKKGLKSLEVDGRRVDVYWDFRQAKLCNKPEPCSDFYVALVWKQEMVLLLGDLEQDAYKRTRSREISEEAKLVYKKENVFAKRLFCTKAVLEKGRKEHDIVVEISLSWPNDPEMWISIDGTVEIRIMNLNWRFRGNEIVMLDDTPVEIFWDVHDWLFSNLGTSRGFFVFKPGRLRGCTDGDGNQNNCSPKANSSATEFCHFLYAWKTE